MIEFFKSWCEGIIVAVIISIIIESILPEGNTKKYVKVVIGIYIIFTILNPFLGKLDTNIEFSDNFNLATVETSSINTENIKKLYAEGIKETLKENIKEEFGYIVTNVEINYDETYENIESIALILQENGIAQIEKVEIGSSQKEDSENNNYDNVKSYISENYIVDKEKITID